MASSDNPLTGRGENPSPYNASAIKKTTWGAFAQNPDETWETTWKLSMKAAPKQNSILILKDDKAGFAAILHTSNPMESQLLIKTRDHAMSAIYYPLTFQAFGIVNDEFGEIDKIEGLPRDWYAPFRNR
ncbi:hypothetical protein ACWGGS_37290 [Streptomyces decoyicus]